MIKATLNSVPSMIAARREFNCNGTLLGTTEDRGVGRLPGDYWSRFETASAATDFFAVYSYATPIAWHANGEWFAPAVKYSVTTSRHQGRMYLAMPGSSRSSV